AIPPNISLEAATLVEPLAIALHSLKIGSVQPGETVLVVGGGPIGLLTIACLKVAGAGRIWAVEHVPARQDMARRMGADDVFDPASTDAAREIMAATNKRGWIAPSIAPPRKAPSTSRSGPCATPAGCC